MAARKLEMELVPEPLHYRSFRKAIGDKAWRRIRLEVLERDNNCCTVCGDSGNICHEIWEYDDVNHVQRLTGFRTLCNMCNFCKHIGLTHRLVAEGKNIDLNAVVEHFCRVNGISREAYTEALMAVSRQQEERNQYEWTQDFGEWSHLVP